MKGLVLGGLIGVLGLLFVMPSDDHTLRPPEPLWVGENTDQITNKRGEQLLIRTWEQNVQSTPKALIFFFHGMHSHSGEIYIRQHWYNISQYNIKVYGIDQVGHGQSATNQTRGYVESWEYFIHDALHWVETVMKKPEYENTPFFLAGHSLGGAITILTGLHVQNHLNHSDSIWRNWKGSILLAPPVVQNVSPNWFTVQLLTFIHSIGGSTLPLGPKPDKSKFPSEEDYINYMTDPFAYTGRMKLGFGFTLLNFMDTLRGSIDQVNFPFLALHGDDDLVTLPSGSQLLLEKSQTPEALKKLVIFPGVKHNCMTHGVARELAVPTILQWVEERLA